MLKNHTARRLVFALLMISLLTGLLCGCRKTPPSESPAKGSGTASNASPEDPSVILNEEQFDSFIEEFFIKAVTVDSITLNYFLAHPEAFGIENMTPTYGDVTSPATILQDRKDNQDFSERLKSFKYEYLRADQQIIYDILARELDLSESMDKTDDYSYYIGSIRPIDGIQVQLPIILAEYHFYKVSDIETYIRLLKDTRRYLNDLIEFERERSEKGFFLSDANVDKVISNCEDFLKDPENNLLIVVFNDRLDQYEGLSDKRREQYKERNKELVLNTVLPAYKALLGAMRNLRGEGANDAGLADLPGGAEFARAYLQYTTGSDRTPEQVDALLKDWTDKTLTGIWAILDNDPSLEDDYFNDSLGNIAGDTPENYLARLKDAASLDFPAMKPIRYVVHEVHPLLQAYVSPAFYLTPALDHYDDNVIYINPAEITDNLSLFTTLAHEGYPGHMYQTVYYLQQSPPPIRTVLGDTGYTEGWATYVEFQSYFYAGLDETEAELLQKSRLFDLLIISRVDLGVNALGWDFDKVVSFYKDIGLEDTGAVRDIYDTVTGNPLLYLPYCLGYLEIASLLDEAKSALGNKFDLLEFHRFLLDFGPAPFALIHTHMQDWIETQSAGTLAPAA